MHRPHRITIHQHKEFLEGGRVRFVHNVADAPLVDIHVVALDNKSEKATFLGLGYSQNTGYMNVKAGERSFMVTLSGTSTAVSKIRFPVENGRSYTCIIHGLVAMNNVDTFPVEDATLCTAVGKAAVRFIHASAGSPNVDILGPGRVTLFSNIGYGMDGGYLNAPAGKIALDVAVTGPKQTIVLSLAPLNLEAGKAYTVIARGIVGNEKTPLAVTILNDQNEFCSITGM